MSLDPPAHCRLLPPPDNRPSLPAPLLSSQRRMLGDRAEAREPGVALEGDPVEAGAKATGDPATLSRRQPPEASDAAKGRADSTSLVIRLGGAAEGRLPRSRAGAVASRERGGWEVCCGFVHRCFVLFSRGAFQRPAAQQRVKD